MGLSPSSAPCSSEPQSGKPRLGKPQQKENGKASSLSVFFWSPLGGALLAGGACRQQPEARRAVKPSIRAQKGAGHDRASLLARSVCGSGRRVDERPLADFFEHGRRKRLPRA